MIRRWRARLRRLFCRHRFLIGPSVRTENHELNRVVYATVECQDCGLFLYCGHAITVASMNKARDRWEYEKLHEFAVREAINGLGHELVRQRRGWWRFL